MKIHKQLLLIILTFFIIACGSAVSKKNYDKIKSGMNKNEVINILGEPKDTLSIGIGGFSGDVATWESQEIIITIQFVDDKVTLTSYNKRDSK